MLGTSQLIRQGSKKCRGFHYLSIIQLRTLLFIERSGRCTMKELAQYLGVTAPTASVMINNLELDGLVARQADKIDRRLMHIRISAKGKKKSHEAMEHLKNKLSAMFDRLSIKEQGQFSDLLEKILTSDKQ